MITERDLAPGQVWDFPPEACRAKVRIRDVLPLKSTGGSLVLFTYLYSNGSELHRERGVEELLAHLTHYRGFPLAPEYE